MKREVHVRWLSPLLVMLILGTIVAPVSASRQEPGRAQRPALGVLNTTIYLTTATLQPLFQSRIDQQLPNIMNSTLETQVSGLPDASKTWAKQLANALIQPSATLTQLSTRQDGLAATLSLSLYPHDPKPTSASMLVKFSVLDSSTIQVSAQPTDGSPTLVSGPLTTIKVPLGKLTDIRTTPNCGDSALAIDLQLPISLDQGQPTPTPSTTSSPATTLIEERGLADIRNIAHQQNASDTDSYVEITTSALKTLGQSLGSIPVSGTWTAQNLQIGMQNNELVVVSDIVLADTSIKVATATTLILPTIENGTLALHVQKTDLTVLFLKFSEDSYNQQIEQMLNGNLGKQLAGKFNATAVATGGNKHITCAASTSLILTGTINLQ